MFIWRQQINKYEKYSLKTMSVCPGPFRWHRPAMGPKARVMCLAPLVFHRLSRSFDNRYTGCSRN